MDTCITDASRRPGSAIAASVLFLATTIMSGADADTFKGQFYRGDGDVEYLQLLDTSRRMLSPDPELQNVSMLYTPAWNGFVEGPTWNAWWVQNSYGTTYCGLPFYQEPHTTFLQNAQDLWFDQMGDGQRVSAHDWVAPDGCLCDAASPDRFIAKQGDGRIDIHDWGMEFTAAGLLMQAELLLISRDRQAIDRYLPKLRRCADFIESRRDPDKNLLLAGPAGNLLAPSYAGYRRPDGTYGMAYLTGLSVTYIAALDRLIELEKMAGADQQANVYTQRCAAARKGLSHVTTDEGYLIKSLDPDGTRHGVLGADKHAYFEAVCNHDAICFRVVNDGQARRIMDKMTSLPGLRPHDLVITNWPSLDDMYQPATSWLWSFGTWVNGGHWTTCEARMVLAYCRLGRFDDARRSMRQLQKFARQFRMDNPLVQFGGAVYQPRQPINLCYDSFGAPAAMLRGLFEYLYRADGLTLVPHIPPSITRLEQHFPVRFGEKQLYLATAGTGPISAVTVNGEAWTRFDAHAVNLPYEDTPDEAVISIGLGGAAPVRFQPRKPTSDVPDVTAADELLAQYLNDRPETAKAEQPSPAELNQLGKRVMRFRGLYLDLVAAGLANGYEGAHTRLVVQCYVVATERLQLLSDGKLKPLEATVSQRAADASYFQTAIRLCQGLENVLDSYSGAEESHRRRIHALWSKQ